MTGLARIEGLKAIADALHLAGDPELLRAKVRRWIQNEGLPAECIAGRYYADPDALARWLASRRSP